MSNVCPNLLLLAVTAIHVPWGPSAGRKARIIHRNRQMRPLRLWLIALRGSSLKTVSKLCQLGSYFGRLRQPASNCARSEGTIFILRSMVASQAPVEWRKVRKIAYDAPLFRRGIDAAWHVENCPKSTGGNLLIGIGR